MSTYYALNTFPGAEHAAANQHTEFLPTEGLKEQNSDCTTSLGIRVLVIPIEALGEF